MSLRRFVPWIVGFIVLAVTSIFSSNTRAEPNSSPTLSETEGWLKIHLPTFYLRLETFEDISQRAEYSFLPNSPTNRFEVPSLRRDTRPCKLSVSIHTDYKADQRSEALPIYVIDLESISDKIRFGEYGKGIVPLGKVNLESPL